MEPRHYKICLFGMQPTVEAAVRLAADVSAPGVYIVALDATDALLGWKRLQIGVLGAMGQIVEWKQGAVMDVSLQGGPLLCVVAVLAAI